MSEESASKEEQDEGIGCLSHLLLILVSLAIAVPLALFQYEWFDWIPVDDFRWRFLVGFIGVLVGTYGLVMSFKYLILFSVAAVLILSFYQKHTGKTQLLQEVVEGYSIVFAMALDNVDAIVLHAQTEMVEEIEEDLIASADYMNPKVKTFANKAAIKYFTENGDALFKQHGQIIRYLSVFKTINSQWKYVEDPQDQEYFAKASESIETMAGDCDDHDALMTACIKAVGGETQMVTVEGHIFPIVKVADSKFEFNVKVKPLVEQLFYGQYNGEELSVYVLEDGVWLNFDYTANYPGGPFMSDKVIKRIEL